MKDIAEAILDFFKGEKKIKITMYSTQNQFDRGKPTAIIIIEKQWDDPIPDPQTVSSPSPDVPT